MTWRSSWTETFRCPLRKCRSLLCPMEPNSRNLFMRKFGRERVVCTLSARISWPILEMTASNTPSLPTLTQPKALVGRPVEGIKPFTGDADTHNVRDRCYRRHEPNPTNAGSRLLSAPINCSDSSSSGGGCPHCSTVSGTKGQSGSRPHGILCAQGMLRPRSH
jgi:hypothetical protein